MSRRKRRRHKAQDSPERYLESAVSVLRAGAPEQVEPYPFRPQNGIAAYTSWIYAAANINARAIAQLPLRMYVRDGATNVFRTRSVSRRQKDYLRGDNNTKPSRSVLRKSADWGDDWQEVVDAHPVMELLSRGNPYEVGINMLHLIATYLQLTGNCYLHPIIGPLGVPIELWHMPPQWTWVIPASPSEERLVDAYMFGRTRAEWRRFEVDEVMQLKAPNPNSIYYGMGWVEAGWNVIRQNEAGHEMDLASLMNHARPDYLVVMKSGVSGPAMDRFEQKVRERLRGRGKSGEFLSVTGDVDVKPLGWPPKDMKGREEIVEEIAAMSGVPVSLLRANDPNLASATAGYAAWRESTIQFWATLIEEHLNELLLPRFDLSQEDVVLAFDSAVPADDAAILNRVTVLHAGGIMRRSEARAEVGLPTEPDEEQPTVEVEAEDAEVVETVDATDPVEALPAAADGLAPTGTTAVGIEVNGAILTSVVDIVRAVRLGEIEPESGIAILVSLMRVGADDARRIIGSGRVVEPVTVPQPVAAAPTRQPDVDEPEQPADEPGDDPAVKSACCEHGQQVSQKALWKAAPEGSRESVATVMAALDRQRMAVESYLTVAGASASTAGLIAALQRGETIVATTEAIATVIADIVGRAARDAIRVLPETVVFELTDDTVLRIIRERAAKVAETVSETTATRLAETLAEGVREGRTIDQMAREIAQSPEFSIDRATMIARTETNNAYNRAQEEVWKEVGVERVQWLLAPDPCEFCASVSAVHGPQSEGWPVGTPIYNLGDTIIGTDGGTMLIDYEPVTGPALHPNCRCTLLPIPPE